YRLVDFGRVRAGDDDAAAPAVRVGLHHPRRLAHGVEHAVEVDADRLVPALGVVDVYLPVGIALALGGPEAVADVEPSIGEGHVASAVGSDMLVERLRDLVELCPAP